MTISVIAGLPRSGSTLLCNLLAQRDDVRVSSTSVLPAVLGQVSTMLTNSPEVTSDLLNVPGARDRSLDVLRAIVEAWHPDDGRLVIDKSRGWGAGFWLLQRLYPQARVLAIVRDPREVFASVERQHRASAEYGPHAPQMDKASEMFAPGGLIGGPIVWTEDLLRRRPMLPDGRLALMAVNYTGLTSSPATVMAVVDQHLGLEPFDYDFNKVESVATDADELYRFKYPHDGGGRVEPRQSGWQDVVAADVADQIRARWPFFFQAFGY